MNKLTNPENKRILVFFATYNEYENVNELLRRIWHYCPTVDVLVVDDSSPDGTYELLMEIASSDKKIKIIKRPSKLGLGTAHHLAMYYSIQNEYDYLLTMDADLSHDPSSIPELINKLQDNDFVIGSRYMVGGSCDYKGYRKLISVLANRLAKNLLRININEFTTSFRAFRVDKLKEINFKCLHTHGYSFFMEALFMIYQSNSKITEVPIRFRDRNAGTSKIPKYEVFRGVSKLLYLTFLRLNQKYIIPHNNKFNHGECINCSSTLLSIKYSSKYFEDESYNKSNDYKCTSMAHIRKPTVLKCLVCGLHQVPLNEHPSNLEKIYFDVVDDQYLENLKVKEKTFNYAFDQIGSYIPSGSRILEIGSYCGIFGNIVNSKGIDYLGIEPSLWASEYSKKQYNLNVINTNFDYFATVCNDKFNTLVSWDVIEHVRDPGEFLRSAHNLLEAGGYLVLSTIDIDSIFARLMGKNWIWIMEMHLYYFGSGSLERMIIDAGFTIKVIKAYRHYASLRYIYKKISLALPSKFHNFLNKFTFLIPDLIIPVALGDIKLYVAIKNA